MRDKIVIRFLLIGLLLFGLVAAAGAAPFRVAVVSPSTINDTAWGQGMYDALVKLQQEMGKENLQFVYSENLYVIADAAAAIRDYASKGYDLVIAHGVQYGASLAEIAPDFPNVSFAWGSSTDTFSEQGVKNVFAYYLHAEQGGYVLGVLAGKLTKSGVAGIIGPIDAGDPKLSVAGAREGLKSVNPNARIEVNWTGSFSDRALAAAAARTLIDAGADIIMGAGQMSVGGVAFARQRHLRWFGLDSDQTSIAPDIVVASQVYNWVEAIRPMIKLIKQGKRGGEVMEMDLANKGIQVVVNPKARAEVPQGLVENTVQQIASGRLRVSVQ
jgi:basic membrane lipoprotein Med (substrate-binding protein (PBP1-ABC) superfamily)